MPINNKLKKSKLIIIIPARLESKRLKRKLLRMIQGIPMIVRVAKAAKKTSLGEVYVATDSDEISNLCIKNKINFVMTETKIKSGTDRIQKAYENLGKNFDFIVNLQGDLPLFKKDLIKKTMDLFMDKNTDIATAVCDLDKNELDDKNIVKANVNLGLDGTGYARDFLRLTKNEGSYYHHIGLYIYTPKSLKKFVELKQTKNEINRSLEQMRALDNQMKIKVVKLANNPPSVDTFEDLRKIRLLFKKNES
jgi:3-deoxy-manno-octulosonate cytidylyltransferase (CMP-KDO synthetase)